MLPDELCETRAALGGLMRAASSFGGACVLSAWVCFSAPAGAQAKPPANSGLPAGPVDAVVPSAAAVPPVPVNAGWNGEHFFLRSTDGQFQLNPIGYLNANYTVYGNDGEPPDGFAI